MPRSLRPSVAGIAPREVFIRTGQINKNSVHLEVAKAWLRCRNDGIDAFAGRSAIQLAEPFLSQTLERHRDLIDVARPFMGGYYGLPHGVCNAILLPHVQAFNAKVSAARLGDVARAMGVDTKEMNQALAAAACLKAIRQLSKDIGIPSGIQQLGAKAADFPILAANARRDACGFTNPIQANEEEIVGIYSAVP